MSSKPTLIEEIHRWTTSLPGVFTSRRPQMVLLAGIFLGLAARLFLLISRYAVNIFFADQWFFNDATLFQKHTVWQMFTWQFGPERQGVGALLTKMIEPHFRWNSRADSFLVGILVTIAATCALWLKKRLYGRLALLDALIPMIFFTPMQYETVFGEANLSHGPLPLLLVVLYCVSWTCRKPAIRYGLISMFNFLALFTGFGIFIGFLTPLLLLADYAVNLKGTTRGAVYFALAISLAFASLAVYFKGFVFNAAVGCFSWKLRSPLEYLAFLAVMLADFLQIKGTRWVPRISGAAVFLALAAGLFASVRRTRKSGNEWTRNLVAATLIVYALLFCADAAWGRVCMGLGYAQASRYMMYFELGILGLYFCLLNGRGRGARILTSVFAVCLLTTVRINSVDRAEMARLHDGKQAWKACYLQTRDITNCNRVTAFWVNFPWLPHPPFQSKLDYLEKKRLNLFSGFHPRR